MPADQPIACFIDTNIWLYAFVDTGEAAKLVRSRVLIQEHSPVISTQVINEVCFNLVRKANFTEEQIGQLIEAFYTKYRVIELSKAILLQASQLRRQYAFSFWDSLIVASALEADVHILYSEDMQHSLIING